MSGHKPICGECFEPWPCLAHRQYGDRLWKTRRAEEACHRCGKPVTGMKVSVGGGGLLGETVRYHGRQGACRRAGLAHLAERLDTEVDPLRRFEVEVERDRIAKEEVSSRAERESRRLRKLGGEVIRREALEDRLVTVVRLDDGEHSMEWRKDADVSDDLAVFAACQRAGLAIAKEGAVMWPVERKAER
jgi:hypothetical protein